MILQTVCLSVILKVIEQFRGVMADDDREHAAGGAYGKNGGNRTTGFRRSDTEELFLY